VADFIITETTKFSGEWFLPVEQGTSPNRVHGNFNWTERMGKLELFNSFEAPRSTLASKLIIYGETTSAKQITLLHALSTGKRMAMAEAGFKTQESFQSTVCIVGAHVNEKTTYSQIVYRVPGLLLWLGNKGASFSHTDPPTPTVTYTFENAFSERLEFAERGLVVEFRIGRETPLSFAATVTIESHGGIKIVPDKPQTLDWLFGEAGKIVSLLSFIAGAPMFPDLILAQLSDGRELSILVALNSKTMCTFTHVHEFFLLRDSLGNDFNAIIEKWFSLRKKIESPMQLALGIFSSPNLWLHVEFISLMQALEGLHRALMSGQYMPESEYARVAAKLTDAIPKSVASDHQEALKGRIKYGSEYSLRKRLKDLVDPLPTSIKLLILGGPNVPSQWVDTRNYFTHWDEAGKGQALDGAGMHHAGVRMRLLLRVLYLHLIGVSEQVLITALNGTNTESQYLLQLNARSGPTM
jgi:ApeA N-terminal domain 1